MKWHTELIPEKIKIPIRYEDKIMAMGSCFTENIGTKLSDSKYCIDINPFGILYNPLSISNGIRAIIDFQNYQESDLIEYGGLWHSFDHHGDFSDVNIEICLKNINLRLQKAKDNILRTNFLLITLGTASVYFRKDNGEVVNNCHKIPSAFFNYKRLNVEEIYSSLEKSLLQLFEHQPKIQVILTVSPVRHLKDGFIENQLSKSALLLASYQLSKKFEQVFYFPAYEIMMDDLREYRFYKEDMVHPNEIAVDYINERFETSCLSDNETHLRKKIRNLVQASKHKLINPNSEASKQFIHNQINSIKKICNEYPFLDFRQELENYYLKLGHS